MRAARTGPGSWPVMETGKRRRNEDNEDKSGSIKVIFRLINCQAGSGSWASTEK